MVLSSNRSNDAAIDGIEMHDVHGYLINEFMMI